MGHVTKQADSLVIGGRDDLMDGFRRTRIYREASPREQADLESFLQDLRANGPAASLDFRRSLAGNGL